MTSPWPVLGKYRGPLENYIAPGSYQAILKNTSIRGHYRQMIGDNTRAGVPSK